MCFVNVWIVDKSMKCVRALLLVEELGNALKIQPLMTEGFLSRQTLSGMSLKLTARLMSLTWTSSGLHFPKSFTSTVGASTGTLSPQSSPDMAVVWWENRGSLIHRQLFLYPQKKMCLVWSTPNFVCLNARILMQCLLSHDTIEYYIPHCMLVTCTLIG